MLIRSSSAVSQLIMFMKRSRLPRLRDPMARFSAQPEVPVTMKRPEGVPPVVPDAAMVSGPFLPCLGSIWPPGPILSDRDGLLGGLDQLLAVPFAGDLTSSDRVSGNAVGTRAMGRVMGLDS